MNKFTKRIILQALDNSPSPLVILDARKSALPVVYLNHAVEILLGRDVGDIVGRPFGDILAVGHLPGDVRADKTDSNPHASHADRQQWRTSDGPSVSLDVRISRLYDRPGQAGFWMLSVMGDAPLPGKVQARDADALRNELVDAHRQIRRLQRIDPVTGLVNRAAFAEMLERDWSIARREQRRIGVIVFSVDCLAEYREIFGRHATDSLLRKVGHAISGTLRRAGDFSARIAHDRFAVLIGDPEEGQMENYANRIAVKVRNLAIHHPRSTVARFTTVSCGVASEVPAWTRQSMTLLEEAVRHLETDHAASSAHQADRPAQPDDEVIASDT